MTRWTAPTIRNINCGMEVTSYESADLDDEFLGARVTAGRRDSRAGTSATRTTRTTRQQAALAR